VDYLFYVVKPGTCGEHAFSETDAEFQRDVARYNAERAARGGRSPTDC
jgi:cell division protein YceG involved in septum cleavage